MTDPQWTQPPRRQPLRLLERLVRYSFRGPDPWTGFAGASAHVRFRTEAPELSAQLPDEAFVLGREIANVVQGHHAGRPYLAFQALGLAASVRENIVCLELPGEFPLVTVGTRTLKPTEAIRRFLTPEAQGGLREAGLVDLRAGGHYVIATLMRVDPTNPLLSVLAAVEALEGAVHAIPPQIWTAIVRTTPATWPTQRREKTSKFDRPWFHKN